MLLPGNCSPQQGVRQACLASRYNRESNSTGLPTGRGYDGCHGNCDAANLETPWVGWVFTKVCASKKIELRRCTVAQTGRVSVDPFKLAHSL